MSKSKPKEEWLKKLEYNSQDFGESGKYIRLEYAANILRFELSLQKQRIVGEYRKKLGAVYAALEGNNSTMSAKTFKKIINSLFPKF